jgi:DNA polymerase III subunit delta'
MTGDSIWTGVIGQSHAVGLLQAAAREPVHAYLFLGPAGSGKNQAARAFAALLVDPSGDPDGRDARLALAGAHPDVREVQRVGASISVDQASDVIRAASLSPTEGARKVLILDEFHLLVGPAAAMLLKTIEEPPPSTVFIVVADMVTPELVTIASRCVRVDFAALSTDVIVDALVNEGFSTSAATTAAGAAGGNLDRARLLASDPGLAARRDAFAGVPARLDGTGSVVVTIVAELEELIDGAADALKTRHADDITALEERVAATGERGSGRKQLEERHKRELRRHRMDELRSGLGVLAGSYRDALVTSSESGHSTGGAADHHAAVAAAVSDIHGVIESLERNPNESLQLQALLLRLPSLAATH